MQALQGTGIGIKKCKTLPQRDQQPRLASALGYSGNFFIKCPTVPLLRGRMVAVQLVAQDVHPVERLLALRPHRAFTQRRPSVPYAARCAQHARGNCG